MKFVPFVVALALSPLLAAQTRIGKIIVNPLDVYSDPEAKRGAFYQLADKLHIETHASVIRKFLLFHEGDVFRPERLAETERNLRTLHFIKSASVTATEPHDGIVDVIVTTQDAWSIAPETNAGNKGGAATYGANITDTNLLGLGKEVSVQWDKTVDRTRAGIDYQDPALNAQFWTAHLAYGSNSDGNDQRVQFRRPFYSFATPWSADVSYIGFRQHDRLYAGGRSFARFQQSHRFVNASFGLALNPNDEFANRFTGGLRFVNDEFSMLRAHPMLRLPRERDFRYLFVRYDHADNDFLKLNFVNKDLRYEDFNLGRHYGVEGAVSPRALGIASTTEFVHLRGSDGFRLGDQAFVMPSVGVATRFVPGIQNAIARAELIYVNREGSDYPRTLVGHLEARSGWRMDREVQFFADGLTGLRGYRAHTFAGSRSFVLNLEERFHLGREVLQLASPGLVAFFDAGNATDDGFRSLMHLKTDVGFGIRVGLPRTPKNLLRIDFAYALNRDPLGRRGLLVSFSSGQAF